MIERALIDKIQESVNITEVIGSHIKLMKRGVRYFGLCPFHQERTPSFTVNEELGLFYCFGCKTGGNVFQFLMKYHRYTFYEAAQSLAKPLGIALKPSRRGGDQSVLFLEIYKKTASYYQRVFLSAEGAAAREYCAKRLFTEQILTDFHVGYASCGWGALHEFLSQEGYSNDSQVGARVVVEKNGRHFDYFQRRVIFPIYDELNRVVAFGGRTLDESIPKYINSPETYFFQKRQMLYGLNIAKTSILECDEVVLVEGYFDVIMAHQMGMQNCVAPLGTSLTQQHIHKLCRYTHNIVLAFDGDEAGRSAMFRSLPLLLNGDVQVKCLVLPDSKDPCDFLCEYGAEELKRRIAAAPSALEYYVQGHIKGSANKRQALKDFFLFIKNIDSKVLQEECFQMISDVLAISKYSIEKDYYKFLQSKSLLDKKVITASRIKGTKGLSHNPEKYLLFILLNHPQFIQDIDIHLMLHYISSPFYKKLFETLSTLYKNTGILTLEKFLDLLEKKLRAAVLRESFKQEYQMGSQRIIHDCVAKIKLSHIKKQKIHLRERLKKVIGNKAEENKLLEESQFLANEENKLQNPQKYFF